MSNCLYCAHMTCVPENEARPTWDPPNWRCAKGWMLVSGRHGCTDYEREPGTDDDLGEFLTEPFPVAYPPEENG